MFSAVLKLGSNLFYGQSDESERVPSTDGELRRGSLVEKVDENWVIIGEDDEQDVVAATSVPVREETSVMKHDKKRQRITSSSRRKLVEMQTSSLKANYSPYIKSESHFNHNKRTRHQKGRKAISPIMQPRQRSMK